MDKLIQALISEVKLHYQVHKDAPMPSTLRVNLELRVKAFIADQLKICNPGDIVDEAATRIELAYHNDDKAGLVGPWYNEWLRKQG